MTADDLGPGSSIDEWRPLLESGILRLGLVLDVPQVDSLLAFADLLLRWGRTYNLTAVRAPRDVVTHHLLDCLAVVPAIQREFVRTRGRRVLDVGSGAGLPGLVIAVADPTAEVVCIDSVGKKTAFVGQAVANLGLRNVESLQGRVESADLPGFDVIISRAFSSLPEFVRVTERLLHAEGVWIAMKGRVPSDEIAEMPTTWAIHAERLLVPEVEGQRCLVRIKRTPDIPTCERTHSPQPSMVLARNKNPE